jgi:hypothetical protein
MPLSVNVTGLNAFLGKLWLRDSDDPARQIEVAGLYKRRPGRLCKIRPPKIKDRFSDAIRPALPALRLTCICR